ncbi:hypothetical protein TNCV_562081 [Trichonephila clavipes]|uniref:Uncharacterized protein n=1 Tax=Trichonephila clavipes TaxID=2585209 RepID=A0A8X6SAS2_TRICX|nr:hypothetical protein TNCV_562081 [Trichonephila clavipes]
MKTQQGGPVRSRKGRERNDSSYIEERTRSSNKNARRGGAMGPQFLFIFDKGTVYRIMIAEEHLKNKLFKHELKARSLDVNATNCVCCYYADTLGNTSPAVNKEFRYCKWCYKRNQHVESSLS